ncbi:MAG: hypothetical protein BGP16_03300 [Sphingobium sp. 66-54]|nr:MAG: hypothetical protein BGP16_03300 [Sphingobium sp. 66-54]
MKTPADRLFAKDYEDARGKFLNAAEIARGEHRAYGHSLKGPAGEHLTTDVVWLGEKDAANVLVLKSGTHGVELYCGSACTIDILLHQRIPNDWAICCIHAVNPWGTAWGRRENEQNIDLNRNYVDFDAPLPRNDLYREIHADLLVQGTDEAALAASNDAITGAAETHGARAILTARSAGQYEFPDGLHYGGTGPTASRLIMEQIIADYGLSSRANLIIWDYHTGAGPFGHCEPIFLGPPVGQHYNLAKQMFGPWLTTQHNDGAVTPPQTGLGSELWERLCGERTYLLGLEFGTYPMTPSGGILRLDHFLHRQASIDWDQPQTRWIKEGLREEYDPQSDLWRQLVLAQNRITFGMFEAWANE